ncbi:thioesterase, partial [Pseudomonas syringae pv. tagetis]
DWLEETCSGFSLDMLEGDHFFLVDELILLLRHLRRYCERHLAHWRNCT